MYTAKNIQTKADIGKAISPGDTEWTNRQVDSPSSNALVVLPPVRTTNTSTVLSIKGSSQAQMMMITVRRWKKIFTFCELESYILNYDFPSVKSRTFVNDYIKVLQSLGMSDQ